MSIYHIDEFTIQIPDSLTDKSVNIFSLGHDGPSEFGLVVARDRLLDTENISTYLDRQMKVLAEKMPQFTILDRGETVVDRQPAVKIECTWVTQGTRVHQRQIAFLFIHPITRKSAVVLISATAKDRISPSWDTQFAEMISSLRLRNAAG